MKRLWVVIAVAFLLLIAGCSDASDDDPTDGIEDPADTEDSPAPDDDESGDGDDSPSPDSTDEDDPDDKDPPNTETDTDDEDTSTPANGTLEIHAINVGQADATLIIAPSGDTMLIDSGDWTDGGETVLAYLDSQNVERLDHLVSTHGHADHIGGHAAVIEEFETEKDGVGQVWDSGVTQTSQTYERYLDAIDEYNVTLFETQEGDTIPIEGIDVTVLNPPSESTQPDDQHYNAVSILVEHGDVGFITTGDAERDVEQRLVDAYGSALEAEIYQAGHHGSDTSSSSEFLTAVDPDVALISAAYDSQFGHPHEEVLSRFADRDIETIWTGVHGSTVVASDGGSYTVRAQADITTNPTQLRDASEITVDPTVRPEHELALGDGTATDGGPDEEDSGETDEDDGETDEDGGSGRDSAESALVVEPNTEGRIAEHRWQFEDVEFTGEVDEIVVEYPDGTSFDGLSDSDITITMTRSLADGLDTAEIELNEGSYSGSSATFDLDGRYNTDMAGTVEVVIDGIENPDAGEQTATITFIGEDDEVSITEPFTIE